MKCFIASAFGRDDVDAIYERCILPVLKNLSITPLRVDRVNHNEDIDNKIFELIDSVDFLIADLTYARPSVYYEAGYATGKSIPVIYIVKNNHFRARDDDLYGNFRVHFDLQMKNIISWKSPGRTFSDKLLKRVKLIIRPLKRANNLNLKLETERSEFNNLSTYDRLQLLRKTCINRLHYQSFQKFQTGIHFDNGPRHTLGDLFKRVDGKQFQGIGIITTSSATKQLFQDIGWSTIHDYSQDYPKFKKEESHYIIASLKSIPLSRINDGLPFFRQKSHSTFVNEEKSSARSSSSIIFVHIIDSIRSKSEFILALRKIMDQNGLNNNSTKTGTKI